MDIVEVIDVKKSFKDVKAVDEVSLTIKQGEFVGLLGPNGAGKTTLVEMIEGLQQPDKGEIKLFGRNWRNNKDFLLQQIGISFQETFFIEKLTVKETVNLFASF